MLLMGVDRWMKCHFCLFCDASSFECISSSSIIMQVLNVGIKVCNQLQYVGLLYFVLLVILECLL